MSSSYRIIKYLGFCRNLIIHQCFSLIFCFWKIFSHNNFLNHPSNSNQRKIKTFFSLGFDFLKIVILTRTYSMKAFKMYYVY